jgi:prepilin-type N-terminal cleavage/methylation domain-containing protein
MSIQTLQTKRGFTLVETLVAILIFASSIVALLVVTSSGTTEVTFIRNKLTANYLAQQGIELVRSARDRNILSFGQAGWQLFLAETGACQSTNGCTFSFLPNNTIQPEVLACTQQPDPCSLNYSVHAGMYFPSTASVLPDGVPSVFHRSVVIIPTVGLDEAKVVSTVTWTQGVAPQTLTLEEYIYNWSSI